MGYLYSKDRKAAARGSAGGPDLVEQRARSSSITSLESMGAEAAMQSVAEGEEAGGEGVRRRRTMSVGSAVERPWTLVPVAQVPSDTHNEKKWQRGVGVNYGHNSHDKWM